MNTTGIQNYLSNVFRPIYTYDTTTFNFTPRLELSNIDVYSGNSIAVFTAAVGDSNSNVYVGSNAGNPYNITRSCSNVTALGFAAAGGLSNDSNSVYIGYYAGFNSSNAKDTIAIGANAGASGGSSNIFIGTNTRTTGISNIFIGHQISSSTTVSNQIRIGYSNQIPIAADLSQNWVGLGGYTTPENITYSTIDISGSTRIKGNLGVNIDPGTRTLDVNGNFRATDASANVLDFSNGLTRSTAGFASIQNDISVNAVATPIGTLRKGVVLVSAVNKNDSADYASRMMFANTSSTYAADLGSNVAAGDASITISGSNIQITDTTNTTTYSYSITYFPMP